MNSNNGSNNRRRGFFAALVAAFTVGGTGSASGQEGGAAPSRLEEIVVTARRREENLQQVPISIEAVTGDTMEMRGMERIEDVFAQIPNVFAAGTGVAGASGFSMRGIPDIGFFVDGIWQQSSVLLMNRSVAELDRVEVLRGPQGTLFGRDTTGGAIRLYTKLPAEEFGLRMSATTGSYDRRDLVANVDIPLTETLLSKWTVAREQRDGYHQSLLIDRAYGEIDDELVRGDLLWTPTDRLSFRLILEDSMQRSSQTSAGLEFYDPGEPGPSPGFGSIVPFRQYYEILGFTWNNESHATGWPGGEVGEFETKSTWDAAPHGIVVDAQAWTLNVDYDINDNITFNSLTGWRDQVDFRHTHFGGVEFQFFDRSNFFKTRTLSQEFQLTGTHGRVDWVTGLFAWETIGQSRTLTWTLGDIDFAQVLASPACQAWTPDSGVAPCRPLPNNDSFSGSEQEGYAVFGEVSLDLTDTLSLTLGARYHDQDNTSWNEMFAPTTPHRDNISIPGQRMPGNYFQSAGQFNHQSFSFDQDTYRFALTNQFNDDLMAYIGYSEGFDSGGVSLRTIEDAQGNPVEISFPFDPQRIANTEIGVRSDWLDGRLRVNATIFHTEWSDMQQTLQIVNPFTGVIIPTGVTQNVAASEAEGAELTVTGQPTDLFSFDVGIGVLDTGYTEIGPNVISVSLDDKFGRAPELQYSLGGQWDLPIANGGEVTLRLDYNWTDDYIRNYAPDVQAGFSSPTREFDQEAFGLLNARFVYRPPGGQWEVAVFGTNLTDEFYTNGGFAPIVLAMDHNDIGRPREGGVTLRVFFE